MFKAEFWDPKIGFHRVMEFKSLSSLLMKAKQVEKYKIKAYDANQEYLCTYDPRQGWIINKTTSL